MPHLKILRSGLLVIAALLALLPFFSRAATASASDATAPRIWDHANLHAWSVVPFDATPRTPEERAQMFERLGIKRYAYSWREKNIPTFDEEIETMQKHGIEIFAWNLLSFEIDDPRAKAVLEACRRHNLHPTLWVMHTSVGRAERTAALMKARPADAVRPKNDDELKTLTPAQQASYADDVKQIALQVQGESFTKTPAEQKQRVNRRLSASSTSSTLSHLTASRLRSTRTTRGSASWKTKWRSSSD